MNWRKCFSALGVSFFFFSLLTLFFLCEAQAQTRTSGRTGISTQEEDGSPNLFCRSYKFSNDSVTDNSDGSCTISTGGGGGGGTGSLRVKEAGSTIVTAAGTMDFIGNGWDITVGSTSGTANVKQTGIDAGYLTVAATTGLGQERVLTAGGGLSSTDAGAGGLFRLNATVTPSSTNTFTNKTIDATNTVTINASDITDQNAGTDITADLEEETHASEHLADAADEVFAESLGTACTNGQVIKSDGDGTLSCQEDSTGGGSGSLTVQEEGSNVTTNTSTMNFVGSQVTVTDVGGIATITVASTGGADNTTFYSVCSSTSTFTCDYTTDGTDDEVQIQQALDALPANGGMVVLSEGQFNLGDAITVGSSQTITGGGYGTYLKNQTNANDSIFTNATTTSAGNHSLVISNMRLDGNKANQTTAFSVIELFYVTQSRIHDLWVTGGLRTGTFPTVSSDGSGVALKYSDYNTIENIYTYENAYDGIKLRTSDHNTVNNIIAVDNDRAGIQISHHISGDAGSDNNAITNFTVYHSTGTEGAASPVTSGLYVHSGNRNTFSNFAVYGTKQGIGIDGASTRNQFTNMTLETRGVSNQAVIDLEAVSPSPNASYNNFADITIHPISGASQQYIECNSNCDQNTFSNITMSNGDGSGTWTIDVDSGGDSNRFINNFAQDVTLNDSGASNYYKDNNGFHATNDAVYVGNGTLFDEVVLPSCSNATTSKLLYNNTTNAFSCGTDQDTGGGGGGDTTADYVTLATTSGLDNERVLTAGDGIDITDGGAGSTITVLTDLKANGGVVIESTELAVDLGASSITGTLAVGDGGTGATSLNNLITLSTHTTGNYLDTGAGTTNEIEVSGGGSEGATLTIGLPDDVTIGDKLTVTGTIDITSGDISTTADTLSISTGSNFDAIDMAGTTTDPCPSLTAGSIFYNSTSNFFCYCDGTNDLKMNDNTTACF